MHVTHAAAPLRMKCTFFRPAGDFQSSVGEERVRVRKECLTFTCHAAPQLQKHTQTHTDTQTLTGGAQGDKRQKGADGKGGGCLKVAGRRRWGALGVEPRAKTREGVRIKDGCMLFAG